MDFLWYCLISVVSGVLAGMGMGGGTLLLPALTLIMDVDQIMAQGINLLCFVPCAIVCTLIYTKQKLVDYKNGWLIALAAVVVSVVAALLAVQVKGKILKIIFGAFIALLGLVQIVAYIIKKIKEKKEGKLNNSGKTA